MFQPLVVLLLFFFFFFVFQTLNSQTFLSDVCKALLICLRLFIIIAHRRVENTECFYLHCDLTDLELPLLLAAHSLMIFSILSSIMHSDLQDCFSSLTHFLQFLGVFALQKLLWSLPSSFHFKEPFFSSF